MLYRFSTSIFKQRYLQNLSKVQSNDKVTFDKIQKPNKAYQHPFHNRESPMVMSCVRGSQLFNEAVGPEQVSAHYESFSVSRKYALSAWGAWAISSFAAQTDLAFVTRASSWVFIVGVVGWYYWIESRKQGIFPWLSKSYRRINTHEIRNFNMHWNENIRYLIKQYNKTVYQQLEYITIHKEYNTVKMNLLENYLLVEQQQLKNKIKERTNDILEQVVRVEKENKNKQINQILESTKQVLDNEVKSEAVYLDSFQNALKGIEKGEMDYQNDLLQRNMIQRIQSEIQKIQNLTQEEQIKLVSLTKQQFKSIRDSDVRKQKEFLDHKPPIGNLKDHDAIKQQFKSWGQW